MRSFFLFRLIVGMVVALAGSLALIEAPTHLLWMLAVLVTEWGHWLALLALVLLVAGGLGIVSARKFSLTGIAGGGLCIIAVVLTATPVLRAIPVARELPSQLATVFGSVEPRDSEGAPPRSSPLAFADLFRGVPVRALKPRSMIYSQIGDQSLALDLYSPATSDRSVRRPGIIVIHGGGWQSGDRTDQAALNSYLAGRGYVVAAVDYRLAPRSPFPAAFDDVRQALAYLKTHAVEFGLDAQKLVLLGRSAGGQLALLAAYTGRDPAIKGVVALYAPPDLPYSYTFPANPAVVDSKGLLKAYLRGNLNDWLTTYLQASPFYFVGPGSPPTLLIHGRRDEVVSYEQSDRLATRLAGNGRSQFLLTLPWATHGCDMNFSGPCGQLSTYAIERFLAAVTR